MTAKQMMPREVHHFFRKNVVQVIRCKYCVFRKDVDQPGWVKCGLTGRLMSVLGYCSEALYDGEERKNAVDGTDNFGQCSRTC